MLANAFTTKTTSIRFTKNAFNSFIGKTAKIVLQNHFPTSLRTYDKKQNKTKSGLKMVTFLSDQTSNYFS